MEVQIKGDQWNKKFRTVQVNAREKKLEMALQILKACSLRKFFNWGSQKCHFLRSPQDISSKKKYEGKLGSSLFIFPISSVIGADTVFTGEEEGKTETPSRSQDFCYNRHQY